VPFVAVSFGFSDRPVEDLGADAVIDGYGELVGTLERMRSPQAPA
jgi:phosphoglycolate phosphatase